MCRTQARLNFERARRAVRRLERRGLSDFWGRMSVGVGYMCTVSQPSAFMLAVEVLLLMLRGV